MTEKNPKSKTQVNSVWCPNCGIPRTAVVRLKPYLAKKGKVKYYCPSCGLRCDFCKPSNKKEEKKADDVPSMADMAKIGKLAKMVGKVVG